MVSGPANIKGHHTLLLDMDKYHKSKKEIWMVAVSWVYIKIDDMSSPILQQESQNIPDILIFFSEAF